MYPYRLAPFSAIAIITSIWNERENYLSVRRFICSLFNRHLLPATWNWIQTERPWIRYPTSLGRGQAPARISAALEHWHGPAIVESHTNKETTEKIKQHTENANKNPRHKSRNTQIRFSWINNFDHTIEERVSGYLTSFDSYTQCDAPLSST